MKYIWDNDIYPLQCERPIVIILHIYGDKGFFNHFVITKKISLINEKCRLSQLVKYPSRKTPKSLWEKYIYTLQNGN